MEPISEAAKTLVTLSTEQLILVVALAAIVVAGFAIYAVHSIAKGREKG